MSRLCFLRVQAGSVAPIINKPVNVSLFLRMHEYVNHHDFTERFDGNAYRTDIYSLENRNQFR